MTHFLWKMGGSYSQHIIHGKRVCCLTGAQKDDDINDVNDVNGVNDINNIMPSRQMKFEVPF